MLVHWLFMFVDSVTGISTVSILIDVTIVCDTGTLRHQGNRSWCLRCTQIRAHVL